MTDFSHLAGSDNGRPKTVKFDFPHFKGEPWLEIKQANETNKPYYNGLLRFQRRFRRGRNVTVEDVATNRENDRYLYAKHVIVAWGNVSDKSGENVPLSEESCKEFLGAIPIIDMDELRDFAANPRSFTGDDSGDEELAGN